MKTFFRIKPSKRYYEKSHARIQNHGHQNDY